MSSNNSNFEYYQEEFDYSPPFIVDDILYYDVSNNDTDDNNKNCSNNNPIISSKQQKQQGGQEEEEEEEEFYPLLDQQQQQHCEVMTARLKKSHSSSNMLLMKRVSSAFFSVGSMTTMMMDNNNNNNNYSTNDPTTSDSYSNDPSVFLKNCSSSYCCCCCGCSNSVDALYHDIMMNVLSYLSLQDLSSYSQTANRPNLDCCDYLQLQLELALFPNNNNNRNTTYSTITTNTTTILSRLASLDLTKAELLVDQYRALVNINSNGNRVDTNTNTSSNNNSNNPFVKLQQRFQDTLNRDTVVATTTTMIGITSMLGATAAASSCASTADSSATFGTACACVSFAAAAVASHYYGTTANHYTPDNNYPNDNSAAAAATTSADSTSSSSTSSSSVLLLELMAQKLQALLMTVPQQDEGEGLLPLSIANRLRCLRQRYQSSTTTNNISNSEMIHSVTKLSNMDNNHHHHSNNANNRSIIKRRKPVGCVGMYKKVLKEAEASVTTLLLEKRRKIFKSLTNEEQRSVTSAFIDSCSSDDQIDVLKSLVHNCGVDVNGFFVGSENDDDNNVASATTTCALHAAAFLGSTGILEFLCQGVSTTTTEEGRYYNDGGLCDVNIVDTNGWSALHFAVGCSGETGKAVVRILAKYGCNLYHEANNGYTPYHWAQRLSNHAVAEELKRLGADARFVVPNTTMELKKKVLMCSAASAAASIPLSFFANRVLHHGNV